MQVHLVVNSFRPAALEAAQRVVQRLRADGVLLGTERDTAEALGLPAVPTAEFGNADLIVSIGGDGTLLRAAHFVSAMGTPILGVNFGRFGFVCAFEPEEAEGAILAALKGEMQTQKRMMSQTELIRDGKVVATLHSLNETVVQRSAMTRILEFRVRVDGTELARYPADGVMVATPTGSTAYSLSAGGPIVHPAVPCLIFAAIMPHTLNARPMVLDAQATVEVSVETRGDAVLACDGHSRLTLLNEDVIRVRRSPRVTRLVVPTPDNFMEKVAQRLSLYQRHWEETDE